MFAGCVNEITLHPRPASRSFAGNVETDHPQVHRLIDGSSVARCGVVKLPEGSLQYYVGCPTAASPVLIDLDTPIPSSQSGGVSELTGNAKSDRRTKIGGDQWSAGWLEFRGKFGLMSPHPGTYDEGRHSRDGVVTEPLPKSIPVSYLQPLNSVQNSSATDQSRRWYSRSSASHHTERE